MKFTMYLCSTLAIAGAWLATAAFCLLRTPLERLHAVTYVNVVTLGFLAITGLLSAGVTSQTLKCLVIVLVSLGAGSLASHATGRAIYARSGEKR